MTNEELIAWLRGEAKPDNPRAFDLAADRIEALVRERDQWIVHAKNAIWTDSEEMKLVEEELKSAKLRIEVLQSVCRGLAEQLMKAHTEIAQAIGKAGGKG